MKYKIIILIISIAMCVALYFILPEQWLIGIGYFIGWIARIIYKEINHKTLENIYPKLQIGDFVLFQEFKDVENHENTKKKRN